jgi:uncharacterized protein YpmS
MIRVNHRNLCILLVYIHIAIFIFATLNVLSDEVFCLNNFRKEPEDNIKTIAMTTNDDISLVLPSYLYRRQQYPILGISINCLIFLPGSIKLDPPHRF